MCSVSAVGDRWSRDWPYIWPNTTPQPWSNPPPEPLNPEKGNITRKEFDELKELVKQMRDELKAARLKDLEEGNPDCEMEEKVKMLKKIAEAMGVDLSEVFPNDQT